MEREAIIWLALIVILLIIEAMTMGLTTIWFAGGGAIAFFASLLGFGIGVQIILFIVCSVILLVLTRPIAMKHFNKEREKTNVESLTGKKALVIEEIDELHNTGKIKVNGLPWSAKPAIEGEIIAKGTTVTIQVVQGVKAVVTKD